MLHIGFKNWILEKLTTEFLKKISKIETDKKVKPKSEPT